MNRFLRFSLVVFSSFVALACTQETEPPRGGDAEFFADADSIHEDASLSSVDAGFLDATELDAGMFDSALPDAQSMDGGVIFQDASSMDAAMLDAQMPDLGWRSELYPSNWDPTFQSSAGHRLHDFSYAGYKNGEASIGVATSTIVYNVVTYGADVSGQTDCTSSVQTAIDEAVSAGGGIREQSSPIPSSKSLAAG